jgi:hypothetical protein
MKNALLIIGMVFGLHSFAQMNVQSIVHSLEKGKSHYQLRSLQAVSAADSADIIWYENFREGLDGNNSSCKYEYA